MILFLSKSYMAPVRKFFFDVISKLKNKYETVAIFSHNPGLTDFANQLTDAKIDNIPTCSIFAVKADTDKWADFQNAKKEFWFFDSPKGGVD